MKPREIVTNIYKLISRHNLDEIKEHIHEECAFRLYTEELLFGIEELYNKINKENYNTVKVIDASQDQSTIYYSIMINNTVQIDGKLKMHDDVVYQLYETKHTELSRIACIVSYDGSPYHGFQRQPNERTIQGDIEKGLYYLTKEEITIQASGRTDKGVHATQQVFHFDTNTNIPPTDIARVLNSYLPDAIHCTKSDLVPNTFHSRFDAVSKTYTYIINKDTYNPIQRNYEWFQDNIDIPRLTNELCSMIGTYDYSAYTKDPDKQKTVRTIHDIKIKETSSHISIELTGTGFLRYMVRYLVGTAVEIASNKLKMTMIDLLEKKDPSIVKWKAPACGLYLTEVTYE